MTKRPISALARVAEREPESFDDRKSGIRVRGPVDRVAEQLHAAVKQFQGAEDGPPREVLLARSIAAILQVAERLDPAELDKAITAPSNVATLITALTQPSTAGLFSSTDPLAQARLRGLLARDALLASEGGTLRAVEVSTLLHISRQAVDKRRAAGNLLAVESGRRGYLYPAWQFTEDGVLGGLSEILALLTEHPPLAKLRFFLSGNHRLGGHRPLDRLRRGDLRAVRRAARALAEQGAA